VVNGIELIEEINKKVYYLDRQGPDFSHKTYDYMVNECKSIIDQLIG